MNRLNNLLRKAREVDQARNGIYIVSEPISEELLLQLRRKPEVVIIDDV